MAANGKGRKIPTGRFEEIYTLYASGVSVRTIHQKCREEWNINVGESAVYDLIRELRKEKRQHLNDIIDADTDDDFGRLKWLQSELEQIAVDTRKDHQLFLKVSDRLIKIYELKLSLRAQVAPKDIPLSFYGRAALIAELANRLIKDNSEHISS